MSYEQFKKLMLELISQYKVIEGRLKNIFKDFDFEKLMESWNLLYALYYGAMVVMGSVSSSVRIDFLARFLDEWFEFKQAWLEKYDEQLFKGILTAIDGLFKFEGATFDQETFHKLMSKALKIPLKE